MAFSQYKPILTSKNGATQNKFLFSSLLALISLLTITIFSLQPAFAVSTNTHLQTTSFTLDNVQVKVSTPFLPTGKLVNFGEPNSVQSTLSQPFQEFVMQVTPFGLTPEQTTFPVAEKGEGVKYQEVLHALRANEGSKSRVGPQATLFGKHVTSEVNVTPFKFDGASTTIIVEWVVETNNSIWTVRISQAQTTRELAQESAFLSSLSKLTLNSTNLQQLSIPGKQQISTNTVTPLTSTPLCQQGASNLSCPSWWIKNSDGTIPDCDTNRSPGTTSVGAYRGVSACGPTNPAYFVTFPGGVQGQEWQCAELAHRYVYLAYGINPIGGTYANGNGIARDYRNHKTASGSTLVRVINGSSDSANDTSPQDLFSSISHISPVAGDIFSEDPTSTQGGHTVLVTNASGLANGNGDFTVIEQNITWQGVAGAHVETYHLSNYVVQAPYNSVIDWLHDPNNGGSHPAQTIGLYLPGQNQTASHFYLKDSLASGIADQTISYGNAPMVPVIGNWDGNSNGVEYVGLYDPTTSVFHLATSNASGVVTATHNFQFGTQNGGYIPIAGDWTGIGQDSVGLYDPVASHFYLERNLGDSKAFTDFSFGTPGGGYTPIAGDWKGTGIDTIGLYLPGATGTASHFYLKDSLTSGVADQTISYGNAPMVPVIGNWIGNGIDYVGLYDPTNSNFHLATSNATGVATATYNFPFGTPNGGYTPIAGHWKP